MNFLSNSALIGGICGAVATAIFSFIKDHYLFKKQSSREDRLRRMKEQEEEKRLVRTLSAKLFGIHNEVDALQYTFLQDFITHYCYVRLTHITTDPQKQKEFSELASEFYRNINDNKARMSKLIREYSEIIGEFQFLYPTSQIEAKFNSFTNSIQVPDIDYSKCNSYDEAVANRLILIRKYQERIKSSYTPKSREVVDTMRREGQALFLDR